MATFERRGKHWRAKIRRKGYRKVSRTFDSRSEAQAWARRVESRMDEGAWTDMTEAQRTTLAEALQRYLRERTPNKKGDRQERIRIHWWLRQDLAERPLAKIRSHDLAEHRDHRLAEGRAPQTVRNELNLISHLFRIARTEWGMEGLRNPVADIEMPKPRRGRDRRLEPGEEERLRGVANPQWDALITFALETGMRRGEIVQLRWEHVDLKHRVAHLPETKNGDARDVPLSPRACDALRSLPRNISGKVFPWQPGTISSGWRKLCARAGVDGLTFHDLRHEATSRLVESGRYNLAEISAITGHKTLDMLKRYTQLRARDLARKMG